LIQRKEWRSLPPKNGGMNITLNGMLQWLAFSMATLLATGVLVLAGLNENGRAESNPASASFAATNPR